MAQFERVWEALLHASRDYATDNRGDVGSWVRKAVMEGMERILFAWRLARSTAGRVQELRRALRGLPLQQQPAAQLETLHLLLCTPDPMLVHATESSGSSSSSSTASALHWDAHYDICSAQYVSGYGNITGYGAGLRILPGGGGGLGHLSATPGAHITSNGHLVGASVLVGEWGVGCLAAVAAGGDLARVTFPPRSCGAACFPYSGGGVFPVAALRHAPRGAAIEAARAAAATAPSTAAAASSSSSSLTPFAATSIFLLPPSVAALDAFLPPAAVAAAVQALLRGAGEKLDLMRAVAGDALCRALSLLPHNLPALAGVERLEELRAVFSDSGRGAAEGATAEQQEEGGEEEREEGSPAAAAAAASPLAPSTTSAIQWSIPHQCYPRLMALLSIPGAPFTGALMEGLSVSVGGLSESVVKSSRAALCAWASEARRGGAQAALLAVVSSLCTLLKPRAKLPWEMSRREEGGGGGSGSGSSYDPSLNRWFLSIMGGGSGGKGSTHSTLATPPQAAASAEAANPATHRVDVRMVVPALRTLEALLSCGSLDEAEGGSSSSSSSSSAAEEEGSSWAAALVALVRKRLLSGKEDVPRVLATTAVMLGLLGFPAAKEAALATVLDVLAHPFPLLRRSAAEKLYVKLLGGGAGEGTQQSECGERGSGHAQWEGALAAHCSHSLYTRTHTRSHPFACRHV